MVVHFGGYGNNRLIHEALAKAFAEQGYSYQVPFYFPSIGEYASLLEQAGFEVRYAVLFDRMTELMGEDGMKDWIRMFISTPYELNIVGAKNGSRHSFMIGMPPWRGKKEAESE